jgi:hypothetical protein
MLRGGSMKRGIPAVMVLVMGFTLVLGIGLYAQVHKDTATGLDRIEGRVQSIQKEKSTLSLQQTGGTIVWQVVYNAQTKYTIRNKPGKVEDVKEGFRVIVLGKFENNTMTAVRIDVRAEK